MSKILKKREKPESKLWQAAFGMSKKDIIEFTAKDFNQYMTLAHFNIGNVKENLINQKQEVST